MLQNVNSDVELMHISDVLVFKKKKDLIHICVYLATH